MFDAHLKASPQSTYCGSEDLMDELDYDLHFVFLNFMDDPTSRVLQMDGIFFM